MKKMYLLILAVTLMFGSCSVRTTTSREIKTSKTKVYQKKLIADLEVDITKKITGTAVVKLNGSDQLAGKTGGATKMYDRAKDMAKWDAIAKSSADAIADPIYNIVQSGSTVTVEVQGFYAKYKSIDLATMNDLMIDIETKLSTGAGISSVSFEQFKLYYDHKFQTEDMAEADKISDYEKYELYQQYQNEAAEYEKTAKSTTHGAKSGKGKKVALVAVGVVLLTTIIRAIR